MLLSVIVGCVESSRDQGMIRGDFLSVRVKPLLQYVNITLKVGDGDDWIWML